MNTFLRNFRLDQISFWLGFLAGSLLWFLITGLRPYLARLRERMRINAQTSRGEAMRENEIRLGNDSLQVAQSWHMAAPLFSLDEILLPPRLLAPPVQPEAEENKSISDITDWVLPYMPDWPELGTFYGAPTITLAEALQGDAHIAVIGQPGSGKTVALAHLASRLIQRDPELGVVVDYVPLLLHAADLILPPSDPDDLSITLLEAIARFASPKSMKRMPKLLDSLFERKRALLLLDGLDELAPDQMNQTVEFLRNLLEQYPDLRVVVSASPFYLDGLLALDFVSIPIAPWSQNQREAFIHRWGDLWRRFVLPVGSNEGDANYLLMLTGWLLTDSANLNPLELTLKVWATFAGDSLGPAPWNAVEAHLRRLMHGQPAKNRGALEHLASQMLLSRQPLTERRSAEAWLSGSTTLPANEPVSEMQETTSKARKDLVKAPGAMPDLLASGLMIARATEQVSFAHPMLAGYLAGQALAQDSSSCSQFLTQPDWTGKLLALQHAALQNGQTTFVEDMLDEENIDPLLSGMFAAARWLQRAPAQLTWTVTIMRKVAALFQKERLPRTIKARALTALILSGNPSVAVLFRQMLGSPQEELRQLAALGCGALHDTKAISELSKLLGDPSPNVVRAALLGLVAIGDKNALEVVAYALLHGDENVRRAAAEALANNSEEGHPTLQEGSTLEDPLVRRAVVYGLVRTKQTWAIETLEKLRSEDSQWVVQDAVIQLLSALDHPNPHIPTKLPVLTQAPWLIAFAAERGMGVAPGKPAYDLLYRAVKEGTEEQRLAAIYYLSRKGDSSSIIPLYQAYYTTSGELCEASFNALWQLAATGIELPPPMQYGLK
ncbi:MAG: HEAT repeat domain-containing protein [Chloroflexota bacterium]